MYRGDKELLKLLSWQMNNLGVGYTENGKLKYKVRGRRFSGDMNTALGNCLVMCAMIYAYAEERGVGISLANNGDDCVVIMEACDLRKFQCNLDEWFLGMGFRMTSEMPVYEFHQIEFCQMRPIETVRGLTMVRNIITSINKDTMVVFPVDSEQAWRKWMYQVGECGLALCAGVPIMQSFYMMLMRNGVDSNMFRDNPNFESGMRMLRGNLEARVEEVTPQARDEVFGAWDITPDEQYAYESHYDGLRLEFSLRSVDNHSDYCRLW
jgi:hypothetical protein